MSEPMLPLLVEPDALEAVLGNEGVLVVDVSDPAAYAQQHVPGAISLLFARLLRPQPPVMGLIAPPAQLAAAFSDIGLTPDAHVVAYDNEGNGRASRLLWTLDVIGHAGFSLLNGGMNAWVGEGHPVETGASSSPAGSAAAQSSAASRYEIDASGAAIADKRYILDHLDDDDVVILDVRSAHEFSGEDLRAARGGHIPGAVNMDWTTAMDRSRNLRFRPEAELREILDRLGVTPDKEVIVHCQTHHRSSHTYVVLRSLGFSRVRGYDGSWSEWGNDPDLPVEA